MARKEETSPFKGGVRPINRQYEDSTASSQFSPVPERDEALSVVHPTAGRRSVAVPWLSDMNRDHPGGAIKLAISEDKVSALWKQLNNEKK
jgi:DNA-binding transcriptional LysR family regulator